MNACGDSRLRGLRSRKPIGFRQWVVHAAELLECFQWNDKEYDLQHVKEELADVMVYSQNLLDALGLDADEIINMKMTMNEAKYPVEKAKGSAKKYNEL